MKDGVKVKTFVVEITEGLELAYFEADRKCNDMFELFGSTWSVSDVHIQDSIIPGANGGEPGRLTRVITFK